MLCNPLAAGCHIDWAAWSAIGALVSAVVAMRTAIIAVRIAREGRDHAKELREADKRDADERDARERKNYAAMLAIAIRRLGDAAERMISSEERIRAQKESPSAFIHQGRLLLNEIAFIRLFRPYAELRNATLLSVVAEVERAALNFENGLAELIRLDEENERARAAHYARPYHERFQSPEWVVRITPGDSWKDVLALPDVCQRAVTALLAAD